GHGMASDTLDIDLVSQSFMRNPLPTLTRLREAGPVVRVKVPFLGRTWLAPCWPAGPASRPGSRSTARPMTTGSASRSWPPAPPPRPWRGAARTCSGSALVFEAMALHHLGQPGKARAALERADEMYRDLLASLADSP